MKTRSCWPETVGGSLVPVTDGSRRHEPSFFRPSPSRAPKFFEPKLRLKLGSFSSRAELEPSFFRAEPEPSPSSLARYQPYRYMFKVYRYTSPKIAQNVCFSSIFPYFDTQLTLHFKHTSRPLQNHLGIYFLFNSSFNFISFFKNPSWISSKTLLIWVITHTQTKHED